MFWVCCKLEASSSRRVYLETGYNLIRTGAIPSQVKLELRLFLTTGSANKNEDISKPHHQFSRLGISSLAAEMTSRAYFSPEKMLDQSKEKV